MHYMVMAVVIALIKFCYEMHFIMVCYSDFCCKELVIDTLPMSECIVQSS